MELLAAFVGFLMAFHVTGLKCWKCDNMDSPEDCAQNGYLETCPRDNDVCQTVVRKIHKEHFVIKGCKDDVLCKKNQIRNSHNLTSRTVCCCHNDACNAKTSTCLELQSCPPLPTMQSGSFVCSNGHNTGSQCKLSCDEQPYEVFPSDGDTITCFGNGSWSKPVPCCSRPCPPYFVYDSVLLYHTSRPEKNFQAVMTLVEQSASRLVVGPDSVMFAGFYYSGSPLLSSKHFFNEYEGNVAVLTDILSKRLRPLNTDDGMVNTGAAMSYAIENFYSAEAGTRSVEVPKVLTIITDSNSNDDVMKPTQQARKLGISTNVIVLKSDDTNLDMGEFRSIAGCDDHVFSIDVHKPDVDAYFEQAARQFCKNPCS